MERLKMRTSDTADENIEKVGRLFPDCVTETKGEDGKVRRAIDFGKLKQELSGSLIDEHEQRYEFTWPDKRKAGLLAGLPIKKTLRPCREESVDFDTTRNLYIEGDNLDVLKCLKETYLGKVKMIYIDPPYNTGKDFVYRDSFASSIDEYKAQSGQYDEQGNRLVTNSDSNGRFHTDWLNMIYPRLKVARDLLAEDGVIFISIDDHEAANLKKVCDEVFGEGNFVGQIIWQTATDNNPTQIATEHEYIVCYARNKNIQPYWSIPSKNAHKIIAKYNDLKTLYGCDINMIRKCLKDWIRENKEKLKGVSHYSYVDKKGVYYPGNSSNTKPGGYLYDIIHPLTGRVCKKPKYGYRWTYEKFKEANEIGDIEWGMDETTIPKIKKRIETVTDMLKTIYYEDNRYWTKYLTSLFGKKVFENPKSVSLISLLINFTTNKDSLILDFFSGSATTAHAVMRLNAEDGGNRRYIMVQIPEVCKEGSEAAKAGYKTICEIGKERIRRAGKKIREELAAKREKEGLFKDENAPMLDTGFRVLKLDTTNMKDVYYRPEDVSQGDLFGQVDNVKADRKGEDLLFQVMLECNTTLDSPIERETIEGKTVYNVNHDFLLACFDEKVTDSVVTAIAKRRPTYAIFRDASMASDAAATNIDEIFKTYSNDTTRRVI